MDIIKSIEHEQLKNKIPELRVGNTVKVHQRIKEGNRERVQVFEGIIIKKQGGGVNATFTVRKIAYGVGVEKTFMVHSPMIEKVEIVRVGKARRAKLYYLRDRVGKAAKTKENIGARIENKEITIKEEMVEEPISEETTTPVENATEEAPAVETENPVVEEVVDTVKEDKVDDMLSNQLKDEEFRKEYEAIQPEMDVIRAIVDARTSQNLTQKELAERTGINQADISKLENGTRNPSVNLLKRLADGMGMALKIEFVPKQKA